MLLSGTHDFYALKQRVKTIYLASSAGDDPLKKSKLPKKIFRDTTYKFPSETIEKEPSFLISYPSVFTFQFFDGRVAEWAAVATKRSNKPAAGERAQRVSPGNRILAQQ